MRALPLSVYCIVSFDAEHKCARVAAKGGELVASGTENANAGKWNLGPVFLNYRAKSDGWRIVNIV